MADLYNKEVVNPGDLASKLAKDVCFQSHRNNPALIVVPHQPGNFRGPVSLVWKKHLLSQMSDYQINEDSGVVESWVLMEGPENDGAGGKPQFCTLVGTPEVFYGLGWEIITMTADDFSRSGRYPAYIVNDIQVKYLTEQNFHLFNTMMSGYGDALRKSRLVNMTGETAIMKHSITAFCDTGSNDQLILTWGATCIGLTRHDLLIDGSKIEPGMPIVGFWEPGYRCNGGTFFTNLILAKWGSRPEKILKEKDAIEFAKRLTVPSLSYAGVISRLLGWDHIAMNLPMGGKMANIAGIAHITGGGIWKKFGDILPAGVGARLDNMPKPANVLLEAQELSWEFPDFRLSDFRAYGTLHGGCGMLLITETVDDAIATMEVAARNGVGAQVVGVTTESPDSIITINSRFKEGKIVRSNEPE